MIAQVEAFFLARLAMIELDDVAIKIYGPGSFRDFGDTELPCIAVTQLIPPSIDHSLSMPHQDVWTPSVEEQVFDIPTTGNIYAAYIEEHGSTITGPASWEWSKYPTPMIMRYQVDILSSIRSHVSAVELLMLEALPEKYTPMINNIPVSIILDGEPINLDELENPLFRSAFRYEITNVWVNRLVSNTVPSISRIELELGTR